MKQIPYGKTPFGGFYRNKKIFITGHTGFKGAWLTAWLLRLGAEVTGYALPPDTAPSLFQALHLHKEIRNIFADVRDLSRLQKAVKAARPDIIFHLAAQPLVLRSLRAPLDTFSVNMLGTAHILQAAHRLERPFALVNVTSDKVYMNPQTGVPLKETDPLGGADPYSLSKAMSEQLTALWRQTLGLGPCATARAGNVLGGGDWAPQRLLPDLIRALHTGKPAALRRPESVRPWQYVLDPLQGYLLLARALYKQPAKFAGAWNFGPAPADCLSVKEVAQQALKTAAQGRLLLRRSGEGDKEAKTLRLNAAKARRELYWRPLFNAQEAVRLAVQWYQAFYAGEKAPALTQRALAAYEAALVKHL